MLRSVCQTISSISRGFLRSKSLRATPSLVSSSHKFSAVRPSTRFFSSSSSSKNSSGNNYKGEYSTNKKIALGLALAGSVATFLIRRDSSVHAQSEHSTESKSTWESIKGWFGGSSSTSLLPDAVPDTWGRVPRTIVIDLDGTIMHSDWDREHGWRIRKRPYLDFFFYRLAQLQGVEVVLWTTQNQYVAESLLQVVDRVGHIQHRLYRETTSYHKGTLIKDLSHLNRDLSRVLVLDCDESLYALQPDNVLLLPKFEGNTSDDALLRYLAFIEHIHREDVADIRELMREYKGSDIPQKFYERNQLLKKEKGVVTDVRKKAGSALFGFGR
eukprot:TRINITY_DN5370_c0_g1_i3.p1 TRINITY_DN5370_c0_g1~~TRINITY_DN5370_c0_g1_i3.p1  ORF type:complete len:328 (+),score=67.82 TRINITY_DN5370_c0_g1_i3:87-1070(+)